MSVIVATEDAALGTMLGEAAERPLPWLGLGRVDLGPLLLVVAGNSWEFARWSRGRVPGWGAGLALPNARVIVVRSDVGDPFATLRHELAHLALHQTVKVRVPLWFDEGYAVLAAEEWGRFAELRLNVAVAAGKVPDLRALDGALRGSVGDAAAGYALAGSAVAELALRHPGGTLEPLLERLRGGSDFEAAVVATTGLTLDRFDEAWGKATRRRYNWGIWLMTGGVGMLVTLVLIGGVYFRRAADRPRRLALNQGWILPPEDDEEITSGEQDRFPLDHPPPGR